MPTRIALFGGIYSNYLALEAACIDARRRGADAIYCLGDLGAFGPYPDRVFPVLHQHQIPCVQGNYDDSVGRGLSDCQCGYLDPRDNHFAQISYDYTLANTSEANRQWLCQLPTEIRLEIDGCRIMLCHGSPRRTNEFLWESTTSSHFLASLGRDFQADVIAGTHTGIHWQRPLAAGGLFVNVGVLGRPENNGRTHVGYTMLKVHRGSASAEYLPLEYDFAQLASDMRREKLPEEFVETVLTGWWTTCLEILPAKERKRGRF